MSTILRTMPIRFIISAALLIVVIVAAVAVDFARRHQVALDETWVTYTNDRYGYQVAGTMGYGRILEENLDVIEADGASGEIPGRETRIFYFKDVGIAANTLGYISCFSDSHPWPELNSDLSLKDYARTLYDIEISIEPGPHYTDKILIADLQQYSLDGREAYSFVYGRSTGERVDILASTIAENAEGHICWIRYSITDHARGYDAAMLEQRTYWFNSFRWTR